MSKSSYNHRSSFLSSYKEEAIKAAKELMYGPEIIKKIYDAENDKEIERIMHDARESRR